MEIAGPLVPGTFVRRENRFRALVEVEGRVTAAHVPNSGRLWELFVPGRTVYLRPAAAAHRKTAFDLVLVRVGDRLVSLDARLPPLLFAEALQQGRLAEFRGCRLAGREVALHGHRIDLVLACPAGHCWVETKSVTLVVGGTALFPDAVTARGRNHVEALRERVAAGERAAVVFVVQRDDAARFRPHDESDPAFGAALRRAAATGVEVYAYTCHVSDARIAIARPIPVVLEGER